MFIGQSGLEANHNRAPTSCAGASQEQPAPSPRVKLLILLGKVIRRRHRVSIDLVDNLG